MTVESARRDLEPVPEDLRPDYAAGHDALAARVVALEDRAPGGPADEIPAAGDAARVAVTIASYALSAWVGWLLRGDGAALVELAPWLIGGPGAVGALALGADGLITIPARALAARARGAG